MSAADTHIVILGNSGFARECFIMLRKMATLDPSIRVRGFLSFEGYKADLKGQAPLFLGIDDDYGFAPGERAVIAIGDPHLRQKAHAKLKARGVPLFTVMHPTAYVDASSGIGEGNIFGARCYVTCDSVIGDCNVFNGSIHVGHDCCIDQYNFIGPGTQILGNVRLGSRNSVGAVSVLLPHCAIGDDNIIAPLSAVYKGCRNGVYMAGNPAVKIGRREDAPSH